MAARSEIRALTGLRGLAAIFVVIFHQAGDIKATGPATNFLLHGYNAVDLFFVLSGFVMALTYGDLFQDDLTPSQYFLFLGRRIARVYPLYALATLFALAISELHFSHLPPVSDPLPTLALNLAAIQAWGFAESIVPPAWSISTEWGAYLAFPALAYFALTGPMWRPLCLAVLALAGLAALAFLPDQVVLGHQAGRGGPLELYDTGTVAPLVRCLTSFSLGMLAYRWRDLFRPSYSLLLTAALIFVLMLPRTDFLFVLICAALVPSLAGSTGLIARGLGSTPIYLLGLWSYSIYILHVRFNPVRSGIERLLHTVHLPFASQCAIGFCTSAVVGSAALTYYCIERPSRFFLRSIFSLRRGRSMEIEPAAP